MKNRSITARLLSLYLETWMYQLIGLSIFVVARIVLLYKEGALSSLISDNLPLFLYNSWRFDIQAITYISLPVIVGILLVLPFLKERGVQMFKSFMRWYYAAMLTILSGIVVAEFFFKENFNSRYNIVFFDFFDEGPFQLLQTMWQDYPFMRILLAILVVGIIILTAGSCIRRISLGAKWKTGVWSTIFAAIVIAGVTFVFMRGSVTRYTLQVEAFMVSTDERINQTVPNAIYLLKKAYKERSNSFKLYSNEELLHREGFATLDEAILAAGFSVPTDLTESDEQKLEKTLFRTHNDDFSQERKSPNVLVILNESWSRFLVEMDNGDDLDLLSTLRDHLKEDLYFSNIQSVRNGTIYSLETVTLAMPYPHFFNSRYRFVNLPTSISYPFKEEGYSTAFIAGMDATWENVQEGLSNQSFDFILGRQNILQSVEGSTTSAIGVYDEFLYQYIQSYLENPVDDRPKFILALTTTNHPPFTYPENMELPPLGDKWYNSPYLTGDGEILRKYGLGAQYANKSLGDFLERFKHSSVADNTIVLVTGDHNVRSVINYEKVGAEYRYAVPMYIYLPQTYRKVLDDEDRVTKRYGSHWDILPTLAPMCLSNKVSYLAIGQDLLDPTNSDDSYYSYNENQVLAADMSKQDSLMRMAKTRELLMKLYYQQQFRGK